CLPGWPPRFIGGRAPQQIALLVRDIHQTLKVYALAGIGPWICYTYGPNSVRDLIYRGSPGRFSMLIALSNTHPEIELIQPLQGRASTASGSRHTAKGYTT